MKFLSIVKSWLTFVKDIIFALFNPFNVSTRIVSNAEIQQLTKKRSKDDSDIDQQHNSQEIQKEIIAGGFRKPDSHKNDEIRESKDKQAKELQPNQTDIVELSSRKSDSRENTEGTESKTLQDKEPQPNQVDIIELSSRKSDSLENTEATESKTMHDNEPLRNQADIIELSWRKADSHKKMEAIKSITVQDNEPLSNQVDIIELISRKTDSHKKTESAESKTIQNNEPLPNQAEIIELGWRMPDSHKKTESAESKTIQNNEPLPNQAEIIELGWRMPDSHKKTEVTKSKTMQDNEQSPNQADISELSWRKHDSYKKVEATESKNMQNNEPLPNLDDIIELSWHKQDLKSQSAENYYPEEQELQSQTHKDVINKFLNREIEVNSNDEDNPRWSRRTEKVQTFKNQINECTSPNSKNYLEWNDNLKWELEGRKRTILSNSAERKIIKSSPKDNFYTPYKSIVDELNNYESQFENQRIFCPCDFSDKDASDDEIAVKSRFYDYFDAKEEIFKIRSFSISGYDPFRTKGGSDNKNLTVARFEDIDYGKHDVVVTCPPPSRFADFLHKMIDVRIKFLILGPIQEICYSSIFSLYKNNKIRFGYTYVTEFLNYKNVLAKSNKWFVWFTNLKTTKDKLYPLTSYYLKHKYPFIDGTQIINVKLSKNIPDDYYGLMAVPIYFVMELLPSQFIVHYLLKKATLNGRKLSPRLIIERTKKE